MITIPDQIQKKWVKSNSSDLFGNLFETRNISFDEEGYLKLAYSPRATMNESVSADWNNVACIVYNGDVSNYFIETWDEPFEIDRDILATAPSQITAVDHPNGAIASDAAWFDAKLAVTESNDLHYYDASTNAWVDTNISLSTTSRSQHPVENFLSKACLAVANVNTVLLYSALSATPTLLATLTIPNGFYVTSMAYFNQNLYIATRHEYGEKAAMFVWNGEGTGAQSVFAVDANIIHDIVAYDGSVAMLVADGGVYRFNGSGFDLLDAFPLYFTERVLTDDTNINIYHGTMRAKGDILYISFSDDDNGVKTMLNQPCGIWCYDKKLGFMYHKYSYSSAMTYKSSDPAINTTTNELTIAQDIPTGTEVWYRASSANSALADNTKYFAIRVDATHVKIARTKALAQAGTAIDFTADDGVSEDWTFFPNIDFGQILCSRPMAMTTIDYSQSRPEYGVDLIWSGELALRDSPTSGDCHLGSVSPGVESRGHFSTPKVFSSEITDKYNLISLKFAPLSSELDKIIIKYRLIDDNRNTIDLSNGGYWLATWTSATTFTSTQAEWADAVDGDEVTILRGGGAGIIAHITDIQESGGTYTVTLDESYEAYRSGDIATAVFRNWKKFATISYGDKNALKGFFKKQLGQVGKQIQLKVELRGIEVKIEELKINNKSMLPSANS